MKWTIRLKFLLVMSGLLTVCLGIYLLMAITVFKSDKTKLVFDLNRSQVANLASELETGLNGVSAKLKLFAQLPVSLQSKMADDLFSGDSDIVAVSLVQPKRKSNSKIYLQNQYLETYGLEEEAFRKKIKGSYVPLATIEKDGEDIWNASIKGAPPLLGFGRLILLLDSQGVPQDQWVVVGYVKLDRFLESISLVSLSEISISNKRGEIIVQKDVKKLIEKPSIQSDKLYQMALSSNSKTSVQDLEIDGVRWLSAYAKAFSGKLFVLSRSPEKEVFRAVRELSTRTLLFGSTILTLVILAAFLISRSLTYNIALLAKRMTSVSQGDLTTNIHLKGRDETVSLGVSFNKMIHDLKNSRDELEIMNRELDKKVKERTKQLEEQNRKVQETQEALLRTTRLASMGEIAGRTAHEVLNPLTSLLTRAGLMQKRVSKKYQAPLQVLEEMRDAWEEDFSNGGFDNLVKCWKEPSEIDPGKNLFDEDLGNLKVIQTKLNEQAAEISKDMEFIRKEGDRIGKIIHGMRRLGNMKSDARAHSLHSILEDCGHIMADLYEQKRFHIVRELNAQADFAVIDRDEIIQAVTNLLRNSLQALDEAARSGRERNELKVKIMTQVHENEIFVDIEDNGVGILQEHQENLFEGQFTTKSPEEGTGLGLSISRRFLRSYGGDIELLKSVPNLQTIFRIRLPIYESDGERKAIA